MKINSLIALCFLCVGASLPPDSAPNFFVSTTGTAVGTGRLSDPISIYTALTNATVTYKTNGSVFWIRGGTYDGNDAINDMFTMRGNGQTFRAYPGEIPILEFGLNFSTTKSNTVRALNFIYPGTHVFATENEYDVTAFHLFYSDSTRTIGNNVVAFTYLGTTGYSDSSNSLSYGDAFVMIGEEFTSNSEKTGRPLYIQNRYGTKRVALNHYWNSLTESISIRGTAASYVNNIYYQSNFSANPGLAGALTINPSATVNIDRGSANESDGLTNVWFTDNVVIQDFDHYNKIQMAIGEFLVGEAGTNFGVHFDNNTTFGGWLNMGNFDATSTFRSNTIWSDNDLWIVRASVFANVSDYPANMLDWNNYYLTGNNAGSRPFRLVTDAEATEINNDYATIAAWRGGIKGDTNSTYTAARPSQTFVKVWKNDFKDQYDDWWGDIAIMNPHLLSNNVPVILTGLAAGTTYEVKFTGALLSNSVTSGTYNGTNISVPMTNLPTYTPVDPSWPKLVQPTNGASFRVYLTGPSQTESPADSTNISIRVNSTRAGRLIFR